MQRIFCSLKEIIADKIVISDPGIIHHIKDVLRLKIGDEVIVCDEKGNVYNSVMEGLTSKNMALKIKAPKTASATEKKIRITVACAIPKKSKFDDIVDKLTQLGVDRIIPMQTERVIVKLDVRKANSRLSRWEKIALSASEQSRRNNLPSIEPIKSIQQILSEAADYDLKLIPALIDKRKNLKEIFCTTRPKNILVLIGPEGDFTPEEVNLAKNVGCIPVTLGDFVLRVETAAVAVASFIRLYANH
ncbi:MAG: 16S rRNA methyltransferase [Candidatus Omnitrophica bacterium CG23_combo_of_CG06-09_8_20_14_all_40_11]|nr:MAG: 16S rRNA methyltransferase [Candidatus Omnitrophica bacterium CG23_combo_of_CG06-09_8_20_14_all_40_11]